MIPSSNPSKKLNREEKSMRIASTEAPIQASTCLKSKEKLQVRIDSSSSSNKIKNTKNSSQNSISPRPASPNPAAKDLEKSLKPLRSPMKKNSGAGIRHTVNLSRATCSTAIKVARNPDSLELNEPKAKLCTYSYCSLHNQKQEAPLPVVKCFLRAKRQSFEAQNRMNQKKKSSGSKNDPNTVQKIEDNTKGAERSRDDAEIMDIVCRINGMMLEDCEKSNQLQDFYSVTSFEDYDEEDKNSEISMEVFDELQGEYLEIEKHGSSKGETNLSSCLQPSYSIDSDEAAAWPYPQHSLQKFDDFFCQTNVISLSTCKQVEADSNIFPENEEEERQVFANGSLQSRVDIPNSPKLEVRREEERDTEAKMANSSQKFDDFLCHTKVIPLSACKQAKVDSNIFPENEEEECQIFTNGSLQSRVHIPNSPKLEVHREEERDTEAKMTNFSQKFDDFPCHAKVIPLSTCKQAELDSNIFPENEEEECKVFANGSLQSRVDTPKSPKLEVHCEEKMANSGLYESSKHESQLKVTRKSNTDGDISDELACEKEKITNSTSLISKNPLTKLSNSPKAKFDSTMRRIPTENHENNAREFNPRTPRFLPPKTVAAAAAEKVTLKHQPMEERKTAEEWMIDYALRQTLRRIAPARKRKVSLLVAAFESVIQQELKTRG